jgi:hypothetical protein
MLLVTCYDVRYEFRIKTMFGSSLPPVVSKKGGLMSYLRCLFLLAHRCVQHILCCMFCFVCLRLVYNMLPVSQDCPFLVFSNIYFEPNCNCQYNASLSARK